MLKRQETTIKIKSDCEQDCYVSQKHLADSHLGQKHIAATNLFLFRFHYANMHTEFSLKKAHTIQFSRSTFLIRLLQSRPKLERILLQLCIFLKLLFCICIIKTKRENNKTKCTQVAAVTTVKDCRAIMVISKRSLQFLPRQKDQTCLAAYLKLAHQGSVQSLPVPASAPQASWLCSHTPAKPSRSSVVSIWDSDDIIT